MSRCSRQSRVYGRDVVSQQQPLPHKYYSARQYRDCVDVWDPFYVWEDQHYNNTRNDSRCELETNLTIPTLLTHDLTGETLDGVSTKSAKFRVQHHVVYRITNEHGK